RDEKGIEIFSDPRQQRGNPHGDEQDHSWRDARRVAYVWDLSQTSGKPIPAPAALPSPPGERQPALWVPLCGLARREGFGGGGGCACPEDAPPLGAPRRIRVL